MTNVEGRKRQSKGTPTGGQFAAENRSESNIDIETGSTIEERAEAARREAERTGVPQRIDISIPDHSSNRYNPHGASLDYGANRKSFDESVDSEPTISTMWATGNDKAPYATVEKSAYITATGTNPDGEREELATLSEEHTGFEYDDVEYKVNSFNRTIYHTDPTNPYGSMVRTDYDRSEETLHDATDLDDAREFAWKQLKYDDPHPLTPAGLEKFPASTPVKEGPVERRESKIKVLRSNPMTGQRTNAMDRSDYRNIVKPWLEKEGKDPKETIRGFKINSKGEITFKSGVGYNVIDEDVLGGDGTGRTYERFKKETGLYFG